jgi:general transcription factor 3C polypeptide 3 (transcription factor C subunit 4)
MVPRRKATSVTDVESDDDDQSAYPDPDIGSSYPYFHTTDPALAAAYAYGDPSGGSHYPDPVTFYGAAVTARSRSRSAGQIQYDDDDEEDDGDDDDEVNEDEELFNRDLAVAQAVADAKLPRIDPDYDSAAEEGIVEAVSDDDVEESDDDTITRGKRGRGRGRARGGRGRGRGTSRATQSARTTRGGGGGRGRGRGRGRSQTGADTTRRRGPPTKKHGPRAMAEPTAEFKHFNSLMNAAYIAEDFEEALKQGLEAIKVNPEMFHVHATIAEILLRKGRKDDALGALYIGVHATRDEGSWWYVIEKLIELGRGTKETLQRLQDCYSSLLDMDPENYKARFGRMKNYIATGQRNRARNECLNLIQRDPFDTEALQVLAEICFAVDEPTVAAPAFKKYFEHVVEQGPPEDTEVAWKLLDMYMDLLVHSSKWDEGLEKLRSLSRWILGRSEETFWDEYDDDREWDFDNEPRRSACEQFDAEKHPLQAYGEGLPIELRQKIGLIRLGLGLQYHAEALVSDVSYGSVVMTDEIKDHFEYMEPDDDSPDAYVYEYPDLFREIGDALREEQLHQDALRFYEPIQRQRKGVDSRFYFDIAICYQALGRTDDVNTTMETLRLFKRGGRDANFYVGLAKLYQSQGKEAEMLSIIRQLKRMGKSEVVIAAGLPLPRETTRPPTRGNTAMEGDDESISGIDGGMFRSMRARSTKARRERKIEQAKFRDKIIQNLHDQLRALEDGVSSEDESAVLDWINIADQLLDEFKTEKLFFPRERAVKFTGYERWQRTVTVPAGDTNFADEVDDDKEIPQHYCGIHFDEWLDMLLQLALQYARQGKDQMCWGVMATIQAANVFTHVSEPERAQKKHNVSLSKCCLFCI